MADNVSVGVSADITQAKAQLGILQASARDLRKEFRLLAQEQAQNKGADPTRYLEVTRQLQGLDREIAKHTVFTRASTKANAEHTDSLRRMGIEFSHLAHAAGLTSEVLRATKFGLAGLVGTQVVRSLGEVSERLLEISNRAKQTGFGTQNIQVMERGFKETGLSAADAKGAIDQLAGAFREAEKGALETGQALGGPTTLRGNIKDATSEITNFGTSAVQVFHGGNKEAVDFSNKLKGVRVDIQSLFQKFPTSPEQRVTEGLKGIANELNALVGAGKFAEANIRSIGLTGLSVDRLLPALNRSIKERERIVADLRGSGQLVDDVMIEKALRYSNAVDDLTDSYQGLQQQIAATVFPDITSWLKEIQEALKRPEGAKTFWQEFLALDEFEKNWNLLKSYGQQFQDWWNAYAKWWADTRSAIRGGASTLAGPQPGLGDPSTPAMPLPAGNASGGLIRGAGSGTSDSILARLSNGEFVVNAASVRRIGVGFLRGLNSFAGGGLVMPSRALPSFAAGGLVSAAAGGGRPVHLHLGGHSFALSGAGSVVDSLVAEAHSQQMRSAGTKPSWYGARPGGR